MVKLAGKVKKNPKAMCPISGDKQLRSQAKDEIALKNRPITAKSVSYAVGSASTGKNSGGSNDTVKSDMKVWAIKSVGKPSPS